jgi:YD repeat-containing protein
LTTAFEYDAAGNRTKTTINGAGLAQNQRFSTTTYGGPYKQFATAASNALGHTSSSTTDPRFGNVTWSKDANNIESFARFDRLGRKLASYSGLGINQSVKYEDGAAVTGAKMKITTTTAGAPTSVSYVDLLGREIRRETQTFSGGWATVSTTYDSRGRKVSVMAPYGTTIGTTNFTYEDDTKLHRLLTETAPDVGVTTYGYSGFTNTVTRNPGAGAPQQVTTRITNSQGWVTSVVDAKNALTTYAYDVHGNLTTVTKPGGSTVQMTYDIRGRKLSLLDPDAGQNTRGQSQIVFRRQPFGR